MWPSKNPKLPRGQLGACIEKVTHVKWVVTQKKGKQRSMNATAENQLSVLKNKSFESLTTHVIKDADNGHTHSIMSTAQKRCDGASSQLQRGATGLRSQRTQSAAALAPLSSPCWIRHHAHDAVRNHLHQKKPQTICSRQPAAHNFCDDLQI